MLFAGILPTRFQTDEIGRLLGPRGGVAIDFVSNRALRVGSSPFDGTALEFVSSVRAGTTATYFDANGILRTAAANELRWDHDPLTGAARGALVEEKRTNALPFSDEINRWSSTRAVILTNTMTAPDGSSGAEKVREDASANSSHFVSRTVPVSASLVNPVTLFFKAGERSHLNLQASASLRTSYNVRVNLNDGSVAGTGAAATRVEALSHGWWRVTALLEAAAGATATTVFISLLESASSSLSYNGDNLSGLFVWRAGSEVGGFSTSSIATTSAPVTRPADQISFALPAGIHDLTYTFDDGSTLAVPGLSGTVTIPTNLPRRHIRSIVARPQ